MPLAIWHSDIRAEPLVVTAIHDGHELHPDVAEWMTLDKPTRLREEDPHTRAFTEIASNRIIVLRSRFEVDLNRPVGDAVCAQPEDCWDLEVWGGGRPPQDVLDRAAKEHEAFYAELESLLRDIEAEHGGFVLLDCHAYNHRRDGPGAPAADPAENPEVNLGTGAMDRARWGTLAERLADELHKADLDARENVRFRGGELSRFTRRKFPDSGCCIALEFKKTFMDEWTGELDRDRLDALIDAVRQTIPGLMEELQAIVGGSSARAARS